METMTESVGGLNASHQLHLLKSCEYADTLLSEIEAILAASTSKSPFPKYKQDLSLAQVQEVLLGSTADLSPVVGCRSV